VLFELSLHLFLLDEAVLDGEEAAFDPLVELDGSGFVVIAAAGGLGGSRSPRSSSSSKATLR